MVWSQKFIDACISPVKEDILYNETRRAMGLSVEAGSKDQSKTNFTPTRICSYCQAVVKEYDFQCPNCGAPRD